MNTLRQADLCKLQMEQLHENITAYVPFDGEYNVAGYDTPKNAQQNKTAIKRQITSLRQSLLALEREVCSSGV